MLDRAPCDGDGQLQAARGHPPPSVPMLPPSTSPGAPLPRVSREAPCCFRSSPPDLPQTAPQQHPLLPYLSFLTAASSPQVRLGEGWDRPGHGEQPPHPSRQKRLTAHLADVVRGHRHLHLPRAVSRRQRLSQCPPARQVRAACPDPQQRRCRGQRKAHFGR